MEAFIGGGWKNEEGQKMEGGNSRVWRDDSRWGG